MYEDPEEAWKAPISLETSVHAVHGKPHTEVPSWKGMCVCSKMIEIPTIEGGKKEVSH